MANVKHHILTAAKTKALTAPGVYADGDGLTMRVAGTGAKNWVLRVTVDGKRRNVGIGGYPAVGLSEARERAEEYRRAVREGRNPIEDRRTAREEAQAKAAIPTFREAAETVIELRRPTWSNERHATQWRESLTIHAFPAIGNKQVTEITSADVMKVLTPIWTAKSETANRVRQRMETVFDYAVVQGWRPDNPANGALSKALPRRPRTKRHHPALPYAKLPEALARIQECTAELSTRLAFEFMVLTAARTGEVRGATWDEMDLEAATWTIPAGRMKARREHRVPLPDRAVDILTEARPLGQGNGLVFPSNRTDGPLSNMVFEMLLRRLAIPAVPHGFRSTFKDWTIEQTATPWAVGEAALAHNLGNSVESAYARSDLFEKRRALMQEWANYLTEGEYLV